MNSIMLIDGESKRIDSEEIYVSFYKNVKDTIGTKRNLFEILNEIRTGNYKGTIENIRACKTKEERNSQKRELAGFTVSGIFSKRKNDCLQTYTSLIQIDIDDIYNPELIKKYLVKDKYTFVAFISPSFTGIKLIIKIDSSLENHLAYFNSLEKYYKSEYKLTIDKSAKDISRLFFVSHDENLFINPNAQIFNINQIDSFYKNKTNMNNETTKEQVEIVVQRIEQSCTDITIGYENWLNVGFALADEYGESGRNLYHSVSKLNAEYSYQSCDEQFTNCLKANGTGITIATFFDLAKKNGIDISFKKSVQINTSTKTTNKADKKELTTVFHQIEEYLSERYELRFNKISLDVEIRIKGEVKWESVNEHDLYIELNKSGIKAPENKLTAILKSNYVEHFNPIKMYFSQLKKWDNAQPDYIKELCSYLTAKEQEQFEYHLKKWLVRSVKCSTIEKYYNKQAFILVQRQQNGGKSTFCRFLCPPALSDYIRDELPEGKDSKIALATNFIINMDELSNLSKRDVNQLKTLFSLDVIKERLPYAKKDSIIQRIANFIGSTNDSDFLVDDTGSVRWLCFEISKIDWNYYKNIKIDDVWRQAYALSNTDDFVSELSKEDIKLNEIRNESFLRTSVEYELITKFFHIDISSNISNKEFHTPADIVCIIASITVGHRLNPISIGKAMKKLGFQRCMNPERKVWGYYINKKSLQ